MIKNKKFVKGISVLLIFVLMISAVVGFATYDNSSKTKEDSYSAISDALKTIAEATATINNELEWLRSNGCETPVKEENPVEETPSVQADTHSDSKYYTDQDAIDIAKVLYTECRGVPSKTERACVAWTVLNRVDNRDSTIYQILREKHQFAFSEDTPVRDDLLDLAYDVLNRWSREKNGESEVGRVLPKNYEYFRGDGYRNYFRNKWDGNYTIWDYSLWSPYNN